MRTVPSLNCVEPDIEKGMRPGCRLFCESVGAIITKELAENSAVTNAKIADIEPIFLVSIRVAAC